MTDRTPQEQREQIVALAKGDKGERGERGEPLNRATRRALVYLFAVAVLIGAANLYWTSYSQSAAQAARARQGLLVERKICTTLARLAVLHPPAGDPQANPSRAYEQKLHVTLSQLGPDLGCK